MSGLRLTAADPTLPAVLLDGNPILRERSAEITEFGEPVAKLVAVMLSVIANGRGRGLAAVQIGVPVRVVVALVRGEVQWMVNPVITRTLNRFVTEREGCLSVLPRNWRPVSRPAKCEIEWQDTDGTSHHRGFSGEMARVLQHEIDHLDGVLITDKPRVQT